MDIFIAIIKLIQIKIINLIHNLNIQKYVLAKYILLRKLKNFIKIKQF